MTIRLLSSRSSKASIDEVKRWIADSQAGSVSAFELLYREFYQRLFAFCHRMTGATGAAEELVQEAYIKAWKALPNFRQESEFYTWLRKIAARLIIDRFRLKQEKIWQQSVELQAEDGLANLHNSEAHIIQLDLEKQIARLPDGARSILVMHDIEGYSHKEIALMLDIAEGTSKAQLSRARGLLKKSFSAHNEDNSGN